MGSVCFGKQSVGKIAMFVVDFLSHCCTNKWINAQLFCCSTVYNLLSGLTGLKFNLVQKVQPIVLSQYSEHI